jgi:anti-anti-sigma regulatory factor
MNERKASRLAKPVRTVSSAHAAEFAAVVAAPILAPPMIQLEAKMTIVQAAVLHRTLAERLAQAEPIVLDASRVEEIDTAILQLLTNLWRTCGQRSIVCTWHGVSDTMRRAAVLIGVDAILCFPIIGPA